ncbi:MAG: thioredoxin family protein [Balneolaceae bacterium]|nr:thioredoxin family protein [Balneolaceae bacterium]
MTEVKTTAITRKTLENAFTYQEYRELTDQLLEQGKTTGENHSEVMLHYTKMNIHRMNRLDNRSEISEELENRLQQATRPMIWLILTEAWCGDAAQSIPVIQKMADLSSKIQTRYILRDENLEIMDQFLTGVKSRSIPKLICLDARNLDILGSWGPRSAESQALYTSLRNQIDLSSRETAERLHKWYADDKTVSLQEEFLTLLDEWEHS